MLVCCGSQTGCCVADCPDPTIAAATVDSASGLIGGSKPGAPGLLSALAASEYLCVHAAAWFRGQCSWGYALSAACIKIVGDHQAGVVAYKPEMPR